MKRGAGVGQTGGAALALAALLAAAAAHAGEEPTTTQSAFRATAISYELTLDYLGLPKGAWTRVGHLLKLSPEWEAARWLSLGARFNLLQALGELGVEAREPSHDFALSDLLLTVATRITEPLSGIEVAGGAHLLLPTSQLSQVATLQVGVGPWAELSRDIPLLAGVTVAYSGRFVFTFNKFKDSQGCSTLKGSEYCIVGPRTSWAVLAHGPSLRFKPHPRVQVAATVLFLTAFLHTFADPNVLGRARSETTSTWFAASIDYQVHDAVAVGIGAGNDEFDVLPETTLFVGARKTTTFFLRLTFSPAALFPGL